MEGEKICRTNVKLLPTPLSTSTTDLQTKTEAQHTTETNILLLITFVTKAKNIFCIAENLGHENIFTFK